MYRTKWLEGEQSEENLRTRIRTFPCFGFGFGCCRKKKIWNLVMPWLYFRIAFFAFPTIPPPLYDFSRKEMAQAKESSDVRLKKQIQPDYSFCTWFGISVHFVWVALSMFKSCIFTSIKSTSRIFFTSLVDWCGAFVWSYMPFLKSYKSSQNEDGEHKKRSMFLRKEK